MNYKEILENVLNNGTPKSPVRFDSQNNPIPVENGTIGTFCEIFRHDMSKGFPLSGMRKLPFKSTCVELEGFIKGVTDKHWYQERNCKFWDEWCNPEDAKLKFDYVMETTPYVYCDVKYENEIELKKAIQKNQDDLGPIYGYQWRNFGEDYNNETPFSTYTLLETKLEGVEEGFDQLKNIVDKLKNNPYDRRMICSAWNPNQLHMMGLPACHYSWTVVVYGNKLNLTWNQRSCDLILGVPQNITSYAVLQLLLCKESGLEPGELVGKLEDCHIYDNLLPKAKELAQREETELPTVNILGGKDFSIFNWTYKDIELLNYNPHPKMDMGKVTV